MRGRHGRGEIETGKGHEIRFGKERGHGAANGSDRRRGDGEYVPASGRLEPDEVTAGRHDAVGLDVRPPPRRDDAPSAARAVADGADAPGDVGTGSLRSSARSEERRVGEECRSRW